VQQVQPLFFKHILAMFLATNAASIKVELVVDNKPNVAKAHKNVKAVKTHNNNDDPKPNICVYHQMLKK
jgi:hypothetical protein